MKKDSHYYGIIVIILNVLCVFVLCLLFVCNVKRLVLMKSTDKVMCKATKKERRGISVYRLPVGGISNPDQSQHHPIRWPKVAHYKRMHHL